ncbi:diguanylate cyclase (GGDEF) domain-containing protein [Propionispora hippei DSM 15287]|uniref:Diguanylate cyclase (GGDEF) domain-containing protein n=2 Tax=Propionispora TaxID=112902 RepID=A0A1M6DUI8_9FIRM|nr:diguanylate cyclase (GGDEF) domain-containing protein [Propionispora hippei DSM 15287]
MLIIGVTAFYGYRIQEARTAQNRHVTITPDMQIELTAEEREFINSLGTLKVAVDERFPPVSCYSRKTGEFDGVSIEVLRILSQTLGFKYTLIPYDELSWIDHLNLIRDNKIDILCAASITDERKSYGYFANTVYFEMNYALIGAIDHHVRLSRINDIARYKVGLVEGMSVNDYLLKFADPQKVTYYRTFDDAFAALRNQEVSLISHNEAAFVERYFTGKLFDYEIVFSINDNIRRYAFFSPKTEKGKKLIQILDKGMKRLDLKAIAGQYYEDKSIFAYYKDHVMQEQRMNELRKFFLLLLLTTFIIFMIATVLMRRRNRELERLAATDYLTGVKNRHALFSEFSDMARLQQSSIIYVDLDHFKAINDNFGHEAGDRVLQEIAARLQKCLPQASVYRMGGDEFLLILESGREFDGAVLLSQIEQPVYHNQNMYCVSASIGYVDITQCSGKSLNEIITMADTVMLQAKASGKNRMVNFSCTMNREPGAEETVGD